MAAWALEVVFGEAAQAAAPEVEAVEVRAPDQPAVPIRKSIHPDYLVCLEDGRKFKSLKRHLRTRYNLSPDEYIARWGLPKDYPMQAPNYARARAELAAKMGLGGGSR
nr:MucR family transcriptional regulator [Brevundimonas sp.]